MSESDDKDEPLVSRLQKLEREKFFRDLEDRLQTERRRLLTYVPALLAIVVSATSYITFDFSRRTARTEVENAIDRSVANVKETSVRTFKIESQLEELRYKQVKLEKDIEQLDSTLSALAKQVSILTETINGKENPK